VRPSPPNPLSHAVGEGPLQAGRRSDPPSPTAWERGRSKLAGDPTPPLSHSVGEGPGVRAQNDANLTLQCATPL